MKRKRWPFLGRVAFLFLVMLFLSAIGANTLIVAVLHRAGAPGVWPLESVVLLAGASVATLVVFFLVTMRRVAFPLGDIVGAAERVAEGDFSVKVIERGPPSLRSIARAFNAMTGRLQANEEQRQRLITDIAHELRTPLTIVQARLEGLLDGVYPRDDEQLNGMLSGTRALTRLVDDLRTLANAESDTLHLAREPNDLRALIDAVATTFPGDDDRGVRIRVEAAALPTVEIDPVRVQQVLWNLLSNAVRHSKPDGVVIVRAQARFDCVSVAVTDSGPGIAPQDLPHIFDRFHKGPRSTGSGLGLAIARALVVAHGGEIQADSRVDRGTTVTFTLPIERRTDE